MKICKEGVRIVNAARGGLINETRYVFWSYAVLISFVSPPFGFSNSFITFVWFVLFGLSLKVPARQGPEYLQETA